MKLKLLAMMVLCLGVAMGGCDRRSGLKGQRNATVTFYGIAVDQDGVPLAGVQFEFDVDAYPANWSMEKAEQGYVRSSAEAVSGADGRFEVTVEGCMLRTRNATKFGYRHFFEESMRGKGNSKESATNAYTQNIRFISWSDRVHKTDPDRPAVFVFVKDGVKEVSALPCRGGFNSSNGQKWWENRARWPDEPSLKDVVRKLPATVPAAR